MVNKLKSRFNKLRLKNLCEPKETECQKDGKVDEGYDVPNAIYLDRHKVWCDKPDYLLAQFQLVRCLPDDKWHYKYLCCKVELVVN